jgi:type IV pilus assembly protein PilA
MYQRAFSLLELIFTIVIIGVLASVAIPKFSGLSDNAKISAELSTAASIQVSIDACHGEWIINEGSFECGSLTITPANVATLMSASGYPLSLDSSGILDAILKVPPQGWSKDGTHYTGPATDPVKGATCKANKPCKTKHWEYDSTTGVFELK